MTKPTEALKRLEEGNKRFLEQNKFASEVHRQDLAGSQEPFATILGCSDSRVPVEIIFDQDFGDLFVIRVAGNIVAPSHIGSVEFAAEKFNTNLVVVMGHSRCGAVTATLEELKRPSGSQSKNLKSIVDRIRPSVEELLSTDLNNNPESLLKHAVRANIRASVNQLVHGSQILEQMVENNQLLVVGAEYSLESGEVDFFYNVPDSYRKD